MALPMTPPERFTVRSAGGVDISIQKTGSGPAMLLIHGSLLNGTLSWGAVMPKLAERFTVYAMDRRGRAPSGDAEAYSIANEADDIVAALAAIGSQTIVLSHSYGALSSIEALNRLERASHLILYEPPVALHRASSDVVDRMERALAAGDREAVVITFLTEQVRAPAERLAGIQDSPIWPIVLDIASTLPRESREVNGYRLKQDQLAASKIPITVLLGTKTTGMLRDAALFLRDTIPGCRLVMLEDQGHGAMMDAPDYFAAKILEIA
jgi:pimeloyl-ACP methyl ester carboxylesterase